MANDRLIFDLTLNTGAAKKEIERFQKELAKLDKATVSGGSRRGIAAVDAEIKRMNRNVGIGNRFIEQMRVKFDRMGDEGVAAFVNIENRIRQITHEMRAMPTGLLRQRLAEFSRVDVTPVIDGFHGMRNASNKTANKIGRDWGKVNSRFFQFQQAIEDFRFAGMRGAGNNLAMMASTLSGPAGLVAMGTVLGVTVLPTIAESLVGVEKAAAAATKELDKTLSRTAALIAQREVAFQAGKGLSGKSAQDAAKQREEKLTELDHARTQLLRYAGHEQLFEEAKAIQREISIVAASEFTPDKERNDALRQRIKDFRKRANRAGVLDPDALLYQSSGWGVGKLFGGGVFTPGDILPSGKVPQSPDNEAFAKRQKEAQAAADKERARIESLRTEIRVIDEYLKKAQQKAEIDRGMGGNVPPMPAVTPAGIETSSIGVPSTSVTNNTSNATTINNYSANIAGLPQRPSLTLREAAAFAAQQMKARQMNTGMG